MMAERRTFIDTADIGVESRIITFTQVGWMVWAANGAPPVLLSMHGITAKDLKNCAKFAPVWMEGPNE